MSRTTESGKSEALQISFDATYFGTKCETIKVFSEITNQSFIIDLTGLEVDLEKHIPFPTISVIKYPEAYVLVTADHARRYFDSLQEMMEDDTWIEIVRLNSTLTSNMTCH